MPVNAAIYEDDILRGLRLFNNLIVGIEHEEDDLDDEFCYQRYMEQEFISISDVNVIYQNNNFTQNHSNIMSDPNQNTDWNNFASVVAAYRAAAQRADANRAAYCAANSIEYTERDADYYDDYDDYYDECSSNDGYRYDDESLWSDDDDDGSHCGSEY
jgi:hypothetical protein